MTLPLKRLIMMCVIKNDNSEIITSNKNLDTYTTLTLKRWRMMCVIKIITRMGGNVETSIKTASSILNYDNSRKC